MKKVKRMLSLCVAVVTAFCLCVSVSASTIGDAHSDATGDESSESSPIMTPNSVYKPSREWNIAQKGQYKFYGESNYQTMYTNYYFTGQYSYYVGVTNNSRNNLRVRVLSLTSSTVYRDFTVPPYTTYSYPIEGTSPYSTQLYIEFNGTDQDFEGYIH